YNCKTGYTFSNNPSLRIASTGYADDTMTYAETWEHQWMMHEWYESSAQFISQKSIHLRVNTSYLTVWIMIHAGFRQSMVKNALLLFQALSISILRPVDVNGP